MKPFLKHAAYLYVLIGIGSSVAHAPLVEDTAGARATFMVGLFWPAIVFIVPPVPASNQE